MRPFIRATTNPDPDSFVRRLIDWWIGDDGYPIPSRAGILRHFERKDEQIIWKDEPTPNSKSITFIPSRLEDNQILMQSDPGYRAWLLSLPLVDRERLLMGNWNSRAEAGKVFKREWIQIVDSVPRGREGSGWDLAVQEKQISGKDPDYTAKVRGILAEDGSFTIVDAWETHCTPAELDGLIRATAQQEQGILQIFEREPGATGAAYLNHIRQMIGPIGVVPRNKDKVAHVRPLSALAEQGKLKILRGPWNALLISRLTGFPDGHDDLVDAAATAYNYLAGINVKEWQGSYSY
jgi:predicted phage terminase large subunit-like protein